MTGTVSGFSFSACRKIGIAGQVREWYFQPASPGCDKGGILMNLHYIKIGLAVIVVAVVTYVFFPANAEHMASMKPATGTGAAGDKNVKAASTASAKQKKIQKKSSHKSSEQAKASEPKIEPDKTLRKENTASRSGPPSKMYGGM
jgi:hypothetical protein